MLDVPFPGEEQLRHYPAFPKPRALQLNVQQGALSIREFLSLRGCTLHTTIAHRNSIIGKVAPASQTLFSDLRMLHQGPECVTQLGDSALAKKLQLFLDLKHSQIRHRLWAALLAQSEHRQFWQPTDYRIDYPDHHAVDARDHLESLAMFSHKILNGEFDFTDADFNAIEQHLGQLRFGDGGALLSHYQEQVNTLKHANAIIQSRLKRPLCFQQKMTMQARYFDNVVRTYFINAVQRRAVKLNQRAATLLKAHFQLEGPLLAYANNDYKAWAAQRDALLEQGKNATTDHVKLIQSLFTQCNLTPAQPQ